jgi:hypothetical protein
MERFQHPVNLFSAHVCLYRHLITSVIYKNASIPTFTSFATAGTVSVASGYGCHFFAVGLIRSELVNNNG